MGRRMLGVIVAGGRPPLEAIGIADDAALTPFAGKYRFIDFALATMRNSGASSIYVMAPLPGPELRAHLARGELAGHRSGAPFLLPLPGEGGQGRSNRLRQTLAGCRELIRTHQPETIVVLLADHILQLDLRQLADAHDDLRADVTLAALPVPVGEATSRTVLRVAGDQRVHEVQRSPVLPATAPGSRAFALSWAGDVVVSAERLDALLDVVPPDGGEDDAGPLQTLADALRVVAHDVLETRLPGCSQGPGAYWHDPTTLEAYYDAQMDLCTPRPALDLYNPAWPVRPVPSGLGPAKVVADAAGRAGQALNTLVSDGAVIRGGVVINGVLGHGVVIESGAEVEDSVLLDGCRIGRRARVRRAVVGAGAMVAEEEEIGYGSLPPTARLVDSGLTVIPAPAANVSDGNR